MVRSDDVHLSTPQPEGTRSAFSVGDVMVPVTSSPLVDWNCLSAPRNDGPTTPSIAPS